jgi:hypothetical protein
MKTLVVYYWFTLLGISGIMSGMFAYNAINPLPETYKANMYRATTYTGKGQFKCQTGC